MRANASTSEVFSLGLLSTAADTSRFGSRMSTARCSRVPFIASFIRSITLSADSSVGSADFCTLGRLIALVDRHERLVGIDGARLGRLHAPRREEVAHLRRHVRARQERPERRGRNRLDRGGRRRGNRRVGVVGQQDEQRQLLLRPRGQRAARRQLPHVALDLAPAKELDDRTVNSWIRHPTSAATPALRPLSAAGSGSRPA